MQFIRLVPGHITLNQNGNNLNRKNIIKTRVMKLKMLVFNVVKPLLVIPLIVLLAFNNQEEKQTGKKQPKCSYEARPNIIFLLTDDQRDNTFSIAGHPVIKTPNLDKLISQGVRFSNTYIAEPICSPSRVSFFTGVHERVHGVGFTSSYELTEDQWKHTYPAMLRDAGYYTGFVGKFGVEYYTFKGKASEKFDFWRAHDGWSRFFPKDFNSGSCKPYHDAKQDIITFIMGEKIDDFFTSLPEDKPFCLSVSFSVPHATQVTSMYTDCDDYRAMLFPANRNLRLKKYPIYDTLYRHSDIKIPEDCETNPYRFIPQLILDQSGRKKTYEFNYNEKSCYEHHIRYYQVLTGLDKIVGDIVSGLDKKGLSENTIIIFASDHGLLMGEYGMGGKALLYDLTSKIPCFIYDPSLPNNLRGLTIDNLVSSLDITKTIFDYANVEPVPYMEGESLLPLVKGQKLAWRDEIFLESLYTGRSNPFSEGVRKGYWKYIRMYKGGDRAHYSEKDLKFDGVKPDFEQLFNLEDDPVEHENLIDKFEGSLLLKELRDKCANYSDNLNKQREAYKKQVTVKSRI